MADVVLAVERHHRVQKNVKPISLYVSCIIFRYSIIIPYSRVWMGYND